VLYIAFLNYSTAWRSTVFSWHLQLC